MAHENAKETLHDRIKDDIAVAFRAGETLRTDALKTLISDAVTQARKKEVRLPTDLEIIALLRKYIVNGNEMAAAYDKGGRVAEAEKSRAEIAILTEYLPAEVSEADVRTFLSGLKASQAVPAGNAGLGFAVKALKEKFGEGFDGRTMTPIAKEIVGG